MALNGLEIAGHVRDVLIAYALALPIGWDQEREVRSAGLRTFPLVAIASCGLVLVAIALFGPRGAAHARVLEGLITGIGFIGGGAIIKSQVRVRGTATAASLWMTAVVGIAVGFRLYDIAVVLSVLNLLTLRLRAAKPTVADAEEEIDA